MPLARRCAARHRFSRRSLPLDPARTIPLPPGVHRLACIPLACCGGVMAQAWQGPTLTDDTLAFGPLALIAPLLQRLDIAHLIARPLPPDPQLVFSHGRVLSLLLAARLCQPTALI